MAGLIPEHCTALVDKYPHYRHILGALFDQTRYFTTAEVLNGLDRQLEHWKAQRDSKLPLVIGLPSSLGSEHWLYHQFQHKLPNHTVHNIADGYLFPEVQVELLLLDDCVLSGCNLCGLIDELLCDPDAKRHPVHLTVMTSITTAAGQEQIRELAVPFTLSQKFFHEYLVAPFQPPPYLTQKEARSFLDEFSPNWTQWAYPVHLEYKIANQFGSFPNVYHACRDPPVKLYPSGK